ncbi:DUF1631 family protein [Pseudothauera rhizosphaerae]|uniref:DUF1631 family protein n=1 Tax=Pseudothauera rhizosphaerae TaxID=2565932 RepID=UPI001454CBD4|nr:DUF1631 family protein [Pseudothauera rhizosphaerae]
MTDRNTLLPSDSAPGPTSYAELLAACGEYQLQRIGTLLEEAVRRIDAELQERRHTAAELAESLSLLEAQYQLRAMGRSLATKFRRSYEAAFRRRTESAPLAAAQSAEDCLLPDFKLFAAPQIAVAPEARELAAPLQEAAAAELAGLRPRVAWLCGHETLSDDADPLGPVAVCEAVLELCAELAGAEENRTLIKGMLADAVRDGLPALYAEMGAQLARFNVPPLRTPAGAAEPPPAAAAVRKAQPAPEAPPPAPRAKTKAPAPANPRPALAGALASLAPGAQALTLGGRSFALRSTKEPHTNLARDLLAQGLGDSLADEERIIVDVVATLFDHLLGSASIPAPMKLLIARLQLPILRLALADRDFFADRGHAARRLLNLFALAGATWDGEITPDSALHRTAIRLIAQIEAESPLDPAVFARSRDAFENWLNEQERAADERAATLTEKLLQRERFELSRREAEKAVAEVCGDEILPETLHRFATTTWVQVLVHSRVNGGSTSAEWREALAVLQDLAWSVRPKYGTDERERLARLLKPLVAALRTAMERAGIDSATRDRFLAELTRLHAAAVKSGMSAPPPADESRPAREIAYRGDAEPEDDLGGELEVDMLGRGDWVELREPGGSVRRVRLTWISPSHTLYLFANRQGQRAVALTREELVRRYNDGEACSAGTDSLDRIVDDALDSHENGK